MGNEPPVLSHQARFGAIRHLRRAVLASLGCALHGNRETGHGQVARSQTAVVVRLGHRQSTGCAVQLAGEVLAAGDPGYDPARAGLERHDRPAPRRDRPLPRRRRCHRGRRFARARHLPVAIRGGGHNVAGHAVCDDGVMIDLSEMRSVQVDPERRRACVEGGATWRDVDRETQAFGLAMPGGLISTPAWRASRSAAASAGCAAAMACPSTISCRPRSLRRTGACCARSVDENADLLWALQRRRRQLRSGYGVRVRVASGRAGADVLRADLPDRGGSRADPLLARLPCRQERPRRLHRRILDHPE